jgi:hypothetical protein
MVHGRHWEAVETDFHNQFPGILEKSSQETAAEIRETNSIVGTLIHRSISSSDCRAPK